MLEVVFRRDEQKKDVRNNFKDWTNEKDKKFGSLFQLLEKENIST